MKHVPPCLPASPKIHAVRRLFEEDRDEPPLMRNMPPMSGAVKWSRSLLARVRRTWVRLEGLGCDVQALEPGRRAAAAMTGERQAAALQVVVVAGAAAGLQPQSLLSLHEAAPPSRVPLLPSRPKLHPCRAGQEHAAV